MYCKGVVKAIVLTLMTVGVGAAFAQAPVFTYPAGGHNYTTGNPVTPLLPKNTGGSVPATIFGQVTTFAGDGSHDLRDGVGRAAATPSPIGIAVDAAGNLYVTDWYLAGIPYLENTIRKITPAGVVTTLAGNAGGSGNTNGPGPTAQFFAPNGTAVDAAGNVYVADVANNLIRKVAPDGTTSTFAGSGAAGFLDGQDVHATFDAPAAVAIDRSGNLYVADYSSNLIRKITPAGLVTTLAGGGPGYGTDGKGALASFHNPSGIIVDPSGNAYVADAGSQEIRKVAPDGTVTTVAGTLNQSGYADGQGTAALFTRPGGIGIDIGGNFFISDTYNNRIRRLSSTGEVITLAGDGSQGNADGIGVAASFNMPSGIGVDANGNVYIGDKGNKLVRKE